MTTKPPKFAPVTGEAALAMRQKTGLNQSRFWSVALSSIRAGAQRAEVFALVPVGHARRGVEWRSA
jgi:hypothetical protein